MTATTPPRTPPTAPPRKVVPPAKLKVAVPPATGKQEPEKTPYERRVEGISGWGQLIAGGLFMVPPLRSDAAAIVLHTPLIAQEAAKLADTDERAAALLDKISAVGPYGALVTAVVALGAQIAVNHGFVKPGFMGTHDPDRLVLHVITGGEADDEPTPA